jgi:hypothetical protein
LLVLLALGACGRRDFDAVVDAAAHTLDGPPDSAPGHDEDADGIPDTMDPCPHVAGDLTDTDGDGVGDACDPNPAMPIDHWALFATMQPGDTAFDSSSIAGTVQQADALQFVGDNAPYLTMPLGNARIDLGWEVNAVVGAGQHQVALGVDNTGPEYYFAELNENVMGVHDAAILQYDATNSYVALASMDSGVFHTGVGLMRLDAGSTHAVVTGWTGQTYSLTATTAAYQGGTGIRFALNGVDVSIRYLAIIVTN